MIYYIVNESFTNIIAFVSILFAFAFTIAAIALGKNLLPRDAGRAYAINGSKSVGKPRGAGMIFILTFTVTCALFVNLCLPPCSADTLMTVLHHHGVI